ncbi:phospholipase D-like domain-containing protein [Stenotrophomonas sp.]|uniref:phospholipase D-like domain-containing protein n=1 Tax=Stenotrophomonas sp. TaxID=69392 RepID=UPI0028A8DC6D|nr:phospholipase D-like domain-containing protein [Stenotrophomonas sp.]
MADGTNTSTVARNALTCQTGQQSTSSRDYYAPADRQFAPIREGNAVQSYTDGRSAMHAMAEAIRGATKFIFIADWQMNFDTELTGRGDREHRGRLSELLFDAINLRGVDVRVLLYDSIEAAAYTHENEARTALYKMRDENTPGNIEVGLHNPATGRSDAFNIAFSHHQKILVIDGKIGFVGGLDVAHGRWDDGNFDVVCDPALHVINDHYNNSVTKARGMTQDEWELTRDIMDTGPDAAGRKRPGFAAAYLPNMATAMDLLKEQWEKGAALAEILDYADKAGIPDAAEHAVTEKIRGLVIPGYSTATSLVQTLGTLLEGIQKSLAQADLKYSEVLASGNRSYDELGKGNVSGAADHALNAAKAFVDIQAKGFMARWDELKATVEAVRETGGKVIDRAGDYIDDPSEIGKDVDKLKAAALDALQKAKDAFLAFEKWLNEPIDRAQMLLDPGRHARMPWQDVHARLEGPAVFDICRNFMHRWNAMVWQNQRGDRAAGQKIRDATNAGIRTANRIGAAIPEQVSLARGRELTPLSGKWLEAMGGRQALFGDVSRRGTAGGITVQVVRSSGTALHTMERDACREHGLDMNDAGLSPYWDRNQPMRSIQDAMLNCIESAQAYVYVETQFLISDCGFSDAEPGRKLDTIITGGRRGELTPAQDKKAKIADRGLGATQGVADRLGAGNAIKDIREFRQGQPSAAHNKLVATLASRIIKAIGCGQDFHVYVTLPVHPEGSLFDGAVLKQQYWVQQSLLRGRDSLIRQIARALVARKLKIRRESVSEADLRAAVAEGGWKDYLTILNLRSYGVLKDTNHDNYRSAPPTAEGSNANPPLYLVTEQCYVHSKLLIVDDAVAIIGSANCNDRSLEGTGDTEIAAVIVDTENRVRNLGNGAMVVTRTFARDLRLRLWKKFLGKSIETGAVPGRVAKDQGYTNMAGSAYHPPIRPNADDVSFIEQPASRACWTAIQKLADANAAAFEEVFQNVPRNSMGTYDAVFQGFATAGMDEKREKVRRYIYAQPSDLQAGYMSVPSVMDGEVTRTVGRHNVSKGLARLRDGAAAVKGFWVTMPLEWGHNMDDPAAAMPNQIIAAVPTHRGINDEGTRMASVNPIKTGTEQV